MSVRRLATLSLLALLALGPVAPAPEAVQAAAVPPARWEFVFALDDLEKGQVEVTWTLYGYAGGLRITTDMPRSEPFVRDLATKNPALKVKEDGDGWQLRGLRKEGTVIRYRLDLLGMAALHGSPDLAQKIDKNYLFNDEAVLLRPDPMPDRADITVEFRLPAGVQLAVPYARLPEPGQRFRFDERQYNGGSYLVLGPALRPVTELDLGGTRARLYLLEGPHQATDAALADWIRSALTAVADFDRALMPKEVVVTLLPAPGSTDPGVFGMVMRQATPSAVIYFGGEAKTLRLHDDWLAVHELFHIQNPLVLRKVPWLVEGFTTYYQDVLRGRVGALSPQETWDSLYDGFTRHCQPSGGRSLLDESRRMYENHRYTRVYWGGACLAFLIDVETRRRSGGKRSLDDTLRELRKRSFDDLLTQDELIAALERDSGAPVRAWLSERKALPLDKAYERLGIVPAGPEHVRLRDDAPLAALRRAMF